MGADGDAVALWDHGALDPPTPPELAAHPAFPTDVEQRLDTYDDLVERLVPDEPHAYLGVLACRPDDAAAPATGSARRRRGLGRRTAAPGIDLALTHGMPAVLETTNPLNVEMYQRADWTVHAVSDELMPELRVWIMRHDGTGRDQQQQ